VLDVNVAALISVVKPLILPSKLYNIVPPDIYLNIVLVKDDINDDCILTNLDIYNFLNKNEFEFNSDQTNGLLYQQFNLYNYELLFTKK
jgi:hypothetical protein